ncbi:MAG: hypothetical protein IT175_06850 [Acidobacteria bacterium]|nr:hypothetical protein [Acidobacteriota bacterium]
MHGVRAIVTVPPYATFIDDVARHPVVGGLRLNTVMPVKGPLDAVLERLAAHGQPLWVDLKGRQLRVVDAAVPPFTSVRLSHRIDVTTPADAFFSDGREYARIVEIDGDRLILDESPRRVVGPGESVNIVADDLRIEGTLTDTDRSYLDAMSRAGLRDVMLSFVESPGDVAEVREILPDANVVLKIESRPGLGYVARHGATHGRLMAARGDLYVEVVQPHRIIAAMREIVRADPDAIVASRILSSLAVDPVPLASDIGDVAFCLEIGYRTFLFGDEVCQRRDTILPALNLFSEIAQASSLP